MSVWFVKPEEVRINLIFTDGQGNEHPFWISVKKELTVGESRRVQTAGWKGIGGGEIGIDWKVQTFARSEAYLLGWSLQEEGVAIPLKRETIEQLAQPVYDLIENAITKHVKEVEEEKKRPLPGDRELKAISA